MINPLDPTTLGAAREAVSLTRSQLAAIVGVAETTIMRIEDGKVDPKLLATWRPIVEAVQRASKGKRRKVAA